MIVNTRRVVLPAVLSTVLLILSVTCVLGWKLSDDAAWVTYSNGYLAVKVGTSGYVDVDLPADAWLTKGLDDPPITGRWAIVTQEGNPETDGDNNEDMNWLAWLCPCGPFGYWTLRVGDTNVLVGDTATGRWYEDWDQYAYGVPRVYEHPEPQDGIGQGIAGGFILGTWRYTVADNEGIDVTVKVGFVRDMARFEYKIRNRTNQQQSIGFQMNCDMEQGSSTSVGNPFVPGVGYVNSSLYPDTFIATLFGATGSPAVPTYIDIFDNVVNPVVVSRNLLSLEDATEPDRFAIGQWEDLLPYGVWLEAGDYGPDPFNAISDYYWTLCWGQKPLAAGGTRTIVTYYGMGAATSRWTYRAGVRNVQDSVLLGVQAPRSLEYDSTNIDGSTILPSPFTITAYVSNLAVDAGPYDMHDVTASLYLPDGLELVSGQTYEKEIGTVLRNSEAQAVTWEVMATGEKCGELEYFVAASGYKGTLDNPEAWQQNVSRTVFVPADKQTVFTYGWQLVSIPFGFNDTLLSHVLGLNAGTFGAKYWDPVLSPSTGNSYFSYTKTEPGRAFWLAIGAINTFGSTLTLPLAVDAAIAGESLGKQVHEVYVDVEPGWNMVGNPFVYPVYWGQVLVKDRSGGEQITLTLDEAITRRWISKTLFAWNPYKWAYDNVMATDELLVPFQGYWLYGRRSVTLVFRPAQFPESDVTAFSGGL